MTRIDYRNSPTLRELNRQKIIYNEYIFQEARQQKFREVLKLKPFPPISRPSGIPSPPDVAQPSIVSRPPWFSRLRAWVLRSLLGLQEWAR